MLFYVKDLCIHGCSSFVREKSTQTDMEQLFFNPSQGKRRDEAVACTSVSTQVSLSHKHLLLYTCFLVVVLNL